MTKAEKRKVIFDKFGGRCAYCGCELQKGWHVDEVLPVIRKYKYVNSHWKNINTKQTVPILQEHHNRKEWIWILANLKKKAKKKSILARLLKTNKKFNYEP